MLKNCVDNSILQCIRIAPAGDHNYCDVSPGFMDTFLTQQQCGSAAAADIESAMAVAAAAGVRFLVSVSMSS